MRARGLVIVVVLAAGCARGSSALAPPPEEPSPSESPATVPDVNLPASPTFVHSTPTSLELIQWQPDPTADSGQISGHVTTWTYDVNVDLGPELRSAETAFGGALGGAEIAVHSGRGPEMWTIDPAGELLVSEADADGVASNVTYVQDSPEHARQLLAALKHKVATAPCPRYIVENNGGCTRPVD